MTTCSAGTSLPNSALLPTRPAWDAFKGKNGAATLDETPARIEKYSLLTLFDRGYAAVRPSYRFAVSRRIRDEFTNRRDDYALEGREIKLPDEEALRPYRERLEGHKPHDLPLLSCP